LDSGLKNGWKKSSAIISYWQNLIFMVLELSPLIASISMALVAEKKINLGWIYFD
jgi:hypothetical protein